MKKLLLVFTVVMIAVVFMANPFSSWENDLNPALMSFRSRGFIEVGVSPEISIDQNYKALPDIIRDAMPPNSVYTIDFNDLYTSLNGNDLSLFALTETGAHASIHFWPLGLGTYAYLKGSMELSVPNKLIDLIANGNKINETYTASSQIFGDLYIDAGAYGALRSDSFALGVKYGYFMPIAKSQNSVYNFKFDTNSQNSTMAATLTGDFSYVSPFSYSQLKNFSAEDIQHEFRNKAGQKLDIGFVTGENRKPFLGVSLNNITLVPAKLDRKNNVTATATVSYNNPLFGGKVDISDPVIKTDETVLYEPILADAPLNMSAFIRLPFILDWIPYIQYYFNDSRVDWGVNAQGNLLWILPFNVGLESINNSWKASAGMGIDIYLVQLYAQVSSRSRNFDMLMNTNNMAFRVDIGVGF
ncbi:MAG TPA: hypothetical protein PLI81_04060 [Petrotogaceae bacterium]|nr:hypothetical protein [Petrotogaceae bacterium]